MVDLLVDCLATFRLTHLVVHDDFPPVAAARDALLDRFGPDSPVSYLVTCVYCSGVWAAGLVTVALGRGRRRRVAWLLAAAAAAPLVEAVLTRLEVADGGRT